MLPIKDERNPCYTVIRKLRETPGGHVSGSDLLAESGLSRTAVWKYIGHLRRLGYRIEASPRLGYRLIRSPDIPYPYEVWPLLKTQRFGHRFEYHSSLPSTNSRASEHAEDGVPEGLVVVADTQTAGRGRLGRTWHSAPGCNLLFTLLLRPAVPLEQAASLPLLLALALCRTIRHLLPSLTPLIKWPNDLLLRGQKTAGMLCEMQAEPDQIRYLLAGIGINVNATRTNFPKELRSVATSLRLESGQPVSRPLFLASFLNQLEPLYDQWCHQGLAPFRSEYQAADALAGKPVRILQGNNRIVEGWADGIEPNGALGVRTPDGSRVIVYSGDAHLLPPRKEVFP